MSLSEKSNLSEKSSAKEMQAARERNQFIRITVKIIQHLFGAEFGALLLGHSFHQIKYLTAKKKKTGTVFILCTSPNCKKRPSLAKCTHAHVQPDIL